MSTEFPYRAEPSHKVGTSTTGTRTTSTLDTAGQLKLDVADKIYLLEVNAHPFVSYLTNVGKTVNGQAVTGSSLSKAVTGNPKFECIEDSHGGVWAKVSGTYAASGALTITVTGAGSEPAYIFTVGDLFKNVRTGEVQKVATVATATTITTASTGRAYGTTAAAAGADGDDLLIIGNVNEQGATVRNVNTTIASKTYNYTQIFRNTISVTGTAEASETYGENDRKFQQRKTAVEHAKSIERHFLFGERKATTGSNGNPEYATGGILEHIVTSDAYVQDQDGPLTAPDFNLFLEKGFTYGSTTDKFLMCGGTVLSAINEFSRGSLQTSIGDEYYGIKIHKYVSAFGDINIVRNPEMQKEYAGYAFLLDMNSYKYRFLKGRDTKLSLNVQTPGTDGMVDEYITECGLERTLASQNALLKGVV